MPTNQPTNQPVFLDIVQIVSEPFALLKLLLGELACLQSV